MVTCYNDFQKVQKFENLLLKPIIGDAVLGCPKFSTKILKIKKLPLDLHVTKISRIEAHLKCHCCLDFYKKLEKIRF